jgi:hypothetical protein
MKTIPERIAINGSFTLEGPGAYDAGKLFSEWLKSIENTEIKSMRFDYSYSPSVEVEEKKEEKKKNENSKS